MILSMILRSLGWISLSRKTKERSILYFMTGILVMILGLMSIFTLIIILQLGWVDKALWRFESIPSLTFLSIPVLLWSIYSLSEFVCYLLSKSLLFKFASINIVAIAFMNIGASMPAKDFFPHPGVGFFIVGFFIMFISASIAAASFFVIKPNSQ